MLKKSVKVLGLAMAMLVVLAGILYVAGVRIVLDGGGIPQLRVSRSADEQAEIIARHREAQRAAAPAPPQAPVVPQAPAPGARTEEVPTLPPRPDTPLTPAVQPPYWTDFRGPARDGHYRQQRIRTDWPSSGLTPLWKQPGGGGYASFVAADGRAFTIEQRADQEVVAAYDVRSGRELWTHSWSGVFREGMGGDGPRATPTWHDGRLYALGGTGELRALDAATGRRLWRTNILEDAGASNLQWGMAASPLIVDDNVIVLPGGGGNSVVAYNRTTGRRAWSALDDTQAYSSPMLVTLAGVRQVLVFSGSRLMGITPDAGAVLWEYPWKTQYGVNASQPLLLDSRRVMISTGYGSGAAAIELTPDGSGGLAVRELWRTNRMKNQFTSSVLHDGYVYGLDEAILACIDASTGALKWKGGRYGYGQVMLADGHLIVLTEGGDLALVRATPERHTELVRFAAIEGKTWNHPAITDGFLLVRNISEMAAFDLRR